MCSLDGKPSPHMIINELWTVGDVEAKLGISNGFGVLSAMYRHQSCGLKNAKDTLRRNSILKYFTTFFKAESLTDANSEKSDCIGSKPTAFPKGDSDRYGVYLAGTWKNKTPADKNKASNMCVFSKTAASPFMMY